MLVGTAGSGEPPVDALLIGARVNVATQSSFLAAVEELEKVAMWHAEMLSAKLKRTHEMETSVADTDEDHLDKRMRSGLQDGVGVQNQGEMESSKLMPIDLEGGGYTLRG